MTKRELIAALEALDVPDGATVYINDNEWGVVKLACVATTEADPYKGTSAQLDLSRHAAGALLFWDNGSCPHGDHPELRD